MKETPLVDFYNRIIFAETEEEVSDINAEIQTAIISMTLTDHKEIMILNLALQVKNNYFMLKELAMNTGETTIMFMGDPEDFDPEQLQLDELAEQEFEDFKDGNVVSMKDFGKKKDEE